MLAGVGWKNPALIAQQMTNSHMEKGEIAMKLKNVLIAVSNIEKSKAFYKELFGLDVVLAQEGNVILTEGLVLQDKAVWEQCLEKEIIFHNHATELYFEEADIEGFVEKLNNYQEKVHYVNQTTAYPWGQKVVRLYDPDGNLIEVRSIERR